MLNIEEVALPRPLERDWAQAICLGAPPFERLKHPAFRVSSVGAPNQACAQWLATACKGSARHEGALFAALGLDHGSVSRAFGSAQLIQDERLPPWAECLIRTIQAMPPQASACVADQNFSDVATHAFLHAAMDLLDWPDLAARYPFLSHEVLISLARQLATRVMLTCSTVLELESAGCAQPAWNFARDAWVERLSGFAALNFVVGTSIRQWRQNALETIERVGRDLPLFRQELFAGAECGPLVSLDGDLGDRHNDGRSVALLTFASGHRAVYKPKNLQSAQRFLGLVALLNEASPTLSLPAQRLICRGRYSWEEYVPQADARSTEEAARFFIRFGMLLRMLQFIEGRDFWIDNLRVEGERPVFIDLECILQPRIAGIGFQVQALDLAPDLYDESVLPTAAVTQPIKVPGVGKQDFGALAMPGPRVLPLGIWRGHRDRSNGNIWLKSGRLYWQPDVAWPRPADKPADVADYFESLEAGYREMQELLRRCAGTGGVAGGIAGKGGPLADVANVPVRALMRSTWEYLVLLRASVEPSALLDGNAREIALANVLATAHPWGDPENLPRRFAIALSEVESIRVLDVPEFHSRPGSTSVVNGAGVEISDVFAGTALERLHTRLSSLDTFDVETHLQILRAAVRSIVRPPQ